MSLHWTSNCSQWFLPPACGLCGWSSGYCSSIAGGTSHGIVCHWCMKVCVSGWMLTCVAKCSEWSVRPEKRYSILHAVHLLLVNFERWSTCEPKRLGITAVWYTGLYSTKMKLHLLKKSSLYVHTMNPGRYYYHALCAWPAVTSPLHQSKSWTHCAPTSCQQRAIENSSGPSVDIQVLYMQDTVFPSSCPCWMELSKSSITHISPVTWQRHSNQSKRKTETDRDASHGRARSHRL